MKTLSFDELDRVVGGKNGYCGTDGVDYDNGRAQIPMDTYVVESTPLNNAQMMSDQINEAYEKAMGPWEEFNDLGAGMGFDHTEAAQEEGW